MNEISLAEKNYSVLDHTPIGICVVSDDNTVLFWNRCMEDWTNIERDDIVGKDISAQFSHFTKPMYQGRLEMIFNGGAPTIFSSQLHGHIFPSHRLDGKMRIYHTTVSGVPSFDNERNYALMAVEDVSDLSQRIASYRDMHSMALKEVEQRKKAEEGLKSANRMILEQQKSVLDEERLKVLLEMAGTTAHELGQPLTILLGSIDMMAFYKDRPDKQEELLKKIKDTGRRMAHVVKKLQSVRYYENMPYANRLSIVETEQNVNLLLVEGLDDDFETIDKMMESNRLINITRVKDVAEAVKHLEEETFDIVVIENSLTDGDGYGLLVHLNEKDIDVPVIIVTGQEDEIIASQLIMAGAYDYMSKTNLSVESLSRSISNALEKSSLKRNVKQSQLQLKELSSKDELTYLYNRRYFMEMMETEVSRAKRYKTELGVCLIDVGRMAEINASHGRSAGDKVLSEIAGILRECVRQSDLCCRYDGKEFAISMPNTPDEDALMVCERIRDMIRKHDFDFESGKIQPTISIGVATSFQQKVSCGADLAAMAGKAVDKAIGDGGNRVILYEAEVEEPVNSSGVAPESVFVTPVDEEPITG